jgi:DNA-directed RNA polymerase subunit E'/Rpb7
MTSAFSKDSMKLLQPSTRFSARSSNRSMSKIGGMSLYIKNIIAKKISVPIKYIGTNIAYVIEKILNDNFEGKCSIEGYVKRGSTKIITFSSGTVVGNIAIFTVVFEYMVCNPPQGMRISCAVKNITNAGILAQIDDSEYSPLNIFIARDHHYNIPYFSELKEGDIIMIRVIGQRFELNDSYVSVIGELELEYNREPRDSIRREIEKSQKIGAPLSVILEEPSNLLGEFSINKKSEEAAESDEDEGSEGVSDEEAKLKSEGEKNIVEPEPEETAEPEESKELEEPEEPEEPEVEKNLEEE